MGDIRIEELNTTVGQGEFIIVCGRTGSGKTTFLKNLKKQLKDEAAFVMQNPDSQIVNDTVRRELSFMVDDELRVAETASYFGISRWMNREVATLSGGEKQILNLASAIVSGARIVLLDEPMAMLDPIMRRRMTQIISNLNKELMITIIIAEHTVDELYELADRVVYIENGASGIYEPDALCGVAPASLLPMSARLFPGCFSMKDAAKHLKGRKCAGYEPEGRSLSDEVVLEARNVSFSYGKHLDKVLSDVNLRLTKGSVTAIVGENGSGKTTLCNLLMGYLRPYGGKIDTHGNKVGMLCQDVTCHFLEDEYDGVNPYDMSAGERQLCALKLVMQKNPAVLILDEPTKGLDGPSKEGVCERIRALSASGVTILIISHDMDMLSEVCDRVHMQSCGRLLPGMEASKFFAGNMFYTTKAAVLMKDIAPGVVSYSGMKKVLEM